MLTIDMEITKRTYFGKYRLLTVNADAKTSKGSKQGYLTGILYMSPGKEADGVHEMCPMASAECLKACLYSAGRAEIFQSIKRARIRRTLMYLRDKERFMKLMRQDIRTLVTWAAKTGMTPAVRVNGTTDVAKLAMELAAEFPEVQFYDYTKLGNPWLRVRPNYHLTFSWSGENLEQCMEALAHGINVAVPFHGALPETWNGYRVVNGDESDLRFLDEAGVIVGLKIKGNKQKKMPAGGFIQQGLINIQPMRVAA